MRYLSVCSGIEAASVAWHHLGWTPVAFSEIEPFPSAVLAHRFPDIPNLGDMTKHEQWTIERGSVDALVGGTPCQSFSVAGLRKGLADPRGNLMLTYLAIAARLRPRWLVWENVPGVLSSNGGRDFGSFLGALGELGYGYAYRVLDAQFVRVGRWSRAVPQRRRRVFVVGCLGDWTAAAEVLALGEGVQRHTEASRKTRKGAAGDAEGGARSGCWPAKVSSTLNHAFGTKLGLEDQHALGGASMFVPRGGCWWDGSDCAGTLTTENAGGGQRMPDKNNLGAVLQPTTVRSGSIGGFVEDTVGGTMRHHGGDLQGGSESLVIAQPVAFPINSMTMGGRPDPTNDSRMTMGLGAAGDPQFTLTKGHSHAVAFHPLQDPISSTDGSTHCIGTGSSRGDATIAVAVAPSLTATNDPSRSPQSSEVTQQVAAVHASTMTVRRLTPRECERLQGFPDDWTLIPWRGKPAEECPDGPRYKALGNSMACNCMAWIGERINAKETT